MPMPTGPKGEKRPRDANSAAVKIARIAVGEEREDYGEPKDEAAAALGRKGGLKGGKARAERLTPAQRSDAAKKAAKARWKR
jgi:hypothetical protein